MQSILLDFLKIDRLCIYFCLFLRLLLYFSGLCFLSKFSYSQCYDPTLDVTYIRSITGVINIKTVIMQLQSFILVIRLIGSQ